MLSIVIPAREEEKAISATITQFKSITLPHEIIVSDDGSSDRTAELAGQLANKVVTFSGVRHTPGRTRNAGAKVAHGEFVAFIDADVVVPEADAFYKRALKHFEDPHIVGVCGPQRALPELETWADRISFGILNAILAFNNNVLHRGEASGKNMVVRKSAFEKVGGLREDIATREDGDFFYRLSKIGRTVYDSSLMVHHGARRAHRVGWLKLWWIWISNTVYFALFNKTIADDWTPVR